jgi:hypothetical protein
MDISQKTIYKWPKHMKRCLITSNQRTIAQNGNEMHFTPITMATTVRNRKQQVGKDVETLDSMHCMAQLL